MGGGEAGCEALRQAAIRLFFPPPSFAESAPRHCPTLAARLVLGTVDRLN